MPAPKKIGARPVWGVGKLWPLAAAVYLMAGDEFTPDNAFTAILLALGGTLIFVGLEILGGALAENQLTTLRLEIGAIFTVPGVALVYGAYHSETLKGWIGPRWTRFVERTAVSFRFWLGLIFIIWLYALIPLIRDAQITALRSDMSNLRNDLNCYASPRRLTMKQIAIISDYLKSYDAQQLHIFPIQGDDEAGIYADDLHQAFQAGGWIVQVGGIPPDEKEADIRDGITTEFMQTSHHAAERSNMPPDPRHPTGDDLLNEAFKRADVQVDGGSSGPSSDKTISQDISYLIIGHRRRDGIGWGCPDDRIVNGQAPPS
jgi:hypothetical protein